MRNKELPPLAQPISEFLQPPPGNLVARVDEGQPAIIVDRLYGQILTLRESGEVQQQVGIFRVRFKAALQHQKSPCRIILIQEILRSRCEISGSCSISLMTLYCISSMCHSAGFVNLDASLDTANMLFYGMFRKELMLRTYKIEVSALKERPPLTLKSGAREHMNLTNFL